MTTSTAAAAVSFASSRLSAPSIRVETVCDYQSFLDLEPTWSELVKAAGSDSPFLEHLWARTWWDSFGAGSSLRALVVKAADQPIAIAPLILTPARICGMRVRRLGFFYNPHVPHADFIMAEQQDAAYRAIWRHLLKDPSWDVLQLCQLPAGSRTLQELSKLAAADGCLVGVWPAGESPRVPLGSSWDQYFKTLPAKHRSNLRNRLKRLSRMGEVTLETVTKGGALGPCLEAGLQLESSGWKRETQTAIVSDPEVQQFYSTLAERTAESGWLLLYFLNVGAQRIAFNYCLSYKNRIYCLKVGYDPSYAPYSPFNLLLLRILEGAFQQGVKEYEFLGLTEDWKLQWTNQTDPYYWLFIFRNTPTGRLLHQTKFRLVPSLQRLPFYRSLRDLALEMSGRTMRRGGGGEG